MYVWRMADMNLWEDNEKRDIRESFDQGVLVLNGPAGFSGFFLGPGVLL